MEPIIKWPGGKRRLVNEILPLIPPIKRRYYEPFAGGAAVAFALLEKGVAPDAMTLSDICRPLISAYQAIQNRPHLLISILESFERQYNKDGEPFYYRLRDNLNESLVNGRVEQPVIMAAQFIFINRTGYNGLWRVNQSGGCNVPIGRYKNPKIVRADLLREAAEVLYGVRFIRAPYHVLTTHMMQPGDVAYFDPPYYNGFTSYSSGGFGEDEQRYLAKMIRILADRGVHIVASNTDCPEVRELYKDFTIHKISARRNINSDATKRGPVPEVIITSD